MIKCQYESCEYPARIRGLCRAHNEQRNKSFELSDIKFRTLKVGTCSVLNCQEMSEHRNGFCSRHRNQRNRHSLTTEQLLELYIKCNATCSNPACDETKLLQVDHDHSCCLGKYSCGKCARGLLCGMCNTAIGYMNDDVNKINGLVKYLSTY